MIYLFCTVITCENRALFQSVTSNSTNEESNQTIDEDEAAVTAMSIHRSLKFAMSLGKKRPTKDKDH
jgi:hypothetical protein